MTAAELIERYAQVRVRLTSGHEPPAKPRRFLLPRGEKVKVIPFPKAADRRPKVPQIIPARAHEAGKPLPIADAEMWKRIVAEVCIKHNVDCDTLTGFDRAVPFMVARQEAMFRMRHEAGMSFPAIGRKLGGRDHSTIIKGILRHERRVAAQ